MRLYELLNGGSVNESLSSFSNIDVLSAVRSVCQIFLRNRANTVISRSETEWSDVCSQLNDGRRLENAVEHLDVATRHLLVQNALRILSEWPISFLAFANDSGISRTHFDGAIHLAPTWMREKIDTALAKQNRNVTQVNLESTFVALTEQLGRPPSRGEIQRHLKWQGKKGLDALYQD